MSDEPRGPLDHRPEEPGWWLAADGRWYPPEEEPTEPVPVVPHEEATAVLPSVRAQGPRAGAARRERRWPLWSTIALATVAVLLIAGVALALLASNTSKHDVRPKTPASSTTTTAVRTISPTTVPATTTPATTLPPSTVPATTTPATKPRTTRPPVTKPPVTEPPTTVPLTVPVVTLSTTGL